MAIDDNTLYGLTGAQVKELPEKIEAVKGLAKVLTTADYNYDYGSTGTNNCLALWLLDSGVYSIAVGMYVLYSSGVGGGISNAPALAIVSKTGAPIYVDIIYRNSADAMYLIRDRVSDGVMWHRYKLLTEGDIKNSLTSTDSTAVLSATQGKVLNDKIGGDLTNLVTTDKTSLINAINELTARVAALEES